MAITSARMQMRRGLEADFDPDKMQPGEWAVSLDKKYVRMCFSVGVCVRMATYDSFEEDMAQIEEILSTCETIEEAVSKINTEVSANAQAVEEYTEQAKKYRDEAKAFRDEAESIAGIDVATKDKAGIVKPDGVTIRVDEDGTIHADNGTVDYNELENKPSINGMELSGDKSLDELGIASVKALEETNSKVNIIIEKAELNIKNSASGENIHLTDSADAKVVGFGLHGKSEQKQYSGKQLIPYPYKYSSGQIVGITYNSNDNDGSMNLNGTTTSILYLVLQGGVLDDAVPIPSWLEVGKEYYISGTKGSVGVILYLYKEDGTRVSFSETKFTMPDGYMYYGLFLYVNSGVTLSNVTVYPMISAEEGEYEPYVGGIASPNPDYPQEITVAGESYNLLDNTAKSKEQNGIIFNVNEDKSISVNGTSSAEAALKTAEHTLNNGEYILSGRNTSLYVRLMGYNSENTWVKIAETNNSDNVLFTIDNSIYSKILVQTIARNNATFDNETIYPMIRKASVKNDRYMPYGKGSVEVVSCGNQLFNANEVEIGKAWNTANNTARAIEVIECKPNTTYTITCDSTLFDGVYYFQKVNKTDTTQIGDGGIIKNNLTITTNENANFLIIQFNKDSVSKTDIENAKVMVNEGTTALPYEPYKETTSTIPTPNGLCGIKVSSGGNYTDENGQQWICDEIVKYADGSGKKIQRIGKYVFNGTESWYKNGESENEYRYYLNKTRIGIDTVNNNGMCTHFQIANTTSQTTILIYSPSVPTSLYIGAQDILTTENTVESFKEWLSNNNVSILYILATPIITDLSAEEIAEIEKLHTFYPVTNISNDADCGMSVTYLCDAKNYIDNRLALIETALVNSI